MSLATLVGWRTRKDWMLITKLDRKESHSSSVLSRTDIGTVTWEGKGFKTHKGVELTSALQVKYITV